MRIIVVRGVANSGKTSAIHRFLKNRQVGFEYKPKADVSLTLPMVKNGQSLLVAVCTNGDIAADVENHLDWAQQLNVDVIVCACRSRGDTYSAVTSFATRRSAPVHEISSKREDRKKWAAAEQAIAVAIEANR